MDYWSILGIGATSDVTAIKRAYVRILRKHHPEDDPEGFLKLRQAYEAILKSLKLPSKESLNTSRHTGKDFDENREESKVTALLFMDKVKALYHDVVKRNNLAEWEKLLEKYTLWHINEKQRAYTMLSAFLQEDHDMDFDILVLLNNYFM
jgi:uncharacterized protein YfbU (UPF0304 family)